MIVRAPQNSVRNRSQRGSQSQTETHSQQQNPIRDEADSTEMPAEK